MREVFYFQRSQPFLSIEPVGDLNSQYDKAGEIIINYFGKTEGTKIYERAKQRRETYLNTPNATVDEGHAKRDGSKRGKDDGRDSQNPNESGEGSGLVFSKHLDHDFIENGYFE